ncbi:DUF1206 domain-containing protein [Nocardia araoensis]|uniref:DUF1206 domain-containing protein n=1 Tax=Nocardia araoensis TaxID=228600 RepID=UPI00030F2E29|nr:DUF1206 domain-containing protein [Nocardia araoensis]
MTHTGLSGTAGRIAQNGVFARFARAGYVMSGLVHLLIGYIAIRLAFGGGGSADQSGAMAELADKPGGVLTLWVAVAAFVVMALWRLAEAVFGSASEQGGGGDQPGVFDRVKAFALFAVYLGLAVTAFRFALGSGKSTSSQSVGLTARLMQHTAGTIALVVGGLVIIAVGGYHVYKGATQSFLDDLRGAPSAFVRRLGTVGYIAKGLAVAAVGLLVILAATESDPNKSAGLDGAIKTLGAQPFGMVLLLIAGLGIITYGLYSFVMARSAKM